jgi:hypothetical protein
MLFFAIAVYFFFPETSGRSLEEVDEIFESTTNIFDTVNVGNNLPRKHIVKRGIALVEKDQELQAKRDDIMEATVKIDN